MKTAGVLGEGPAFIFRCLTQVTMKKFGDEQGIIWYRGKYFLSIVLILVYAFPLVLRSTGTTYGLL